MATYSEELEEWTAAQITDLDVAEKTAGVLELNWSGPEPSSVDELGDLIPLRLTHHDWEGSLSHANHDWVLPRSYRVIGDSTLLHGERSVSYSSGWDLGFQLHLQRRWDRGDRTDWFDPRELVCSGAELDRLLAEHDQPQLQIRSLRVTEIGALDCGRLVRVYPGLTQLGLGGEVGWLTDAARLNELRSLKGLTVMDLFGMTEHDCLLPEKVPDLEHLELFSIPAAYATAMRARWRKEIANGTFVDIRQVRTPDWVAQNASNPFRHWDGREHISRSVYKQVMAQFKDTRQAVLAAALAAPGNERQAQFFDIGRQYAEAFNQMDARSAFIETMEREELFDALDSVAAEAEASCGGGLAAEWENLRAGVESARDW